MNCRDNCGDCLGATVGIHTRIPYYAPASEGHELREPSWLWTEDCCPTPFGPMYAPIHLLEPVV